MKEVTRLMINEFKLKELGYDFMGYFLRKGDIYTFHHLIIPKRKGGEISRENGAILCGKSSHPYLHLIEAIDYEMFCYLTSEMLDMNIKGYLATSNLREIHNILEEFESRYGETTTRKGKALVRSIYRDRKRF